MQGLLGNSIDDPRTMAVLQGVMGLLSARGNVQGVAQGLLGYQGAMQQSKAQAAQEEERAMRRKMAELQLAEAQAAQAQRAKMQAGLQAFAEKLPSPQEQALAQAMGGGGGPTPEAAARMPEVNPMHQQLHGLMRAGVMGPMEYLQAVQARQSKFSTAPQYDQQGRAFILAEDGSMKYLPGVSARDKLISEDLGGKKVFRSEYSATPVGELSKTVTPDALLSASTQRRGQDLSYTVGREANDVQRALNLQAKELQVGKMQDEASDRKRSKEAAVASIGNQLAVLDKAISHPGRTTSTGLSGTLDPRNYVPGTNATNFRVVLDQINGAAFLQAFESLKGGGQITQIEGEKATQAIARLNRAQSDEEFLSSLNELRGIMATGYKRLSGTDYAAPSSGGWSIRPIGGN